MVLLCSLKNGLKRRRSDDSYYNEQPPPKTAKFGDDAIKSHDLEEENDLNNVAWQMHNLREPEEFFAHVQNQWRPDTFSDPHKNLTFRFRKARLRNTGFHLRGTDCHFVSYDSVYAQRMHTIHRSLDAMQKEIAELRKKPRHYGSINDQQRLEYLMNCRSQLRNNMERLQRSKDSAKAIFSAYYNQFYGQDGNQITSLQKSETDNLVDVMNNLRNFYNNPS